MTDDVLSFVLDGLEKWLELERELGVRTVECDPSLLAGLNSEPSSVPASPALASPKPAPQAPVPPKPLPKPMPPPQPAEPAHPVATDPSRGRFDFVFLHDRPLDEKGLEMMSKIIPAMGKTAETAPVVIVPPLPVAKVYVVMGARALRQFFPNVKGEPGQWLKSPDGKTVLVTYSPAFLFRFGTVTPAVKKMKEDMWRSLKVVMQRVRQ